MAGQFSGKVAAVTGAARGIGDAIALRLVEEGATVFSLDLSQSDEAREGVVYLEADVGNPDSVAAAFASIDRQAERFDRTLAEEWAHAKVFASSQQRADTLFESLRRCNYGRAHTAPGGEHLPAKTTTSEGQHA